MLPQLNFRFVCLFLGFAVAGLFAQETPPPAGPDAATMAAAAVASGKVAVPHTPDFIEHLVDSILGAFNIRTSGNTLAHYTISILLLVVALLARRLITNVVFAVLRKLAARTATTLDDKLFPVLEAPAATFVMVVGIFASLKVLKLSPQADLYIASGSQVAFSLVLFWAIWRSLAALLSHGTEIAQAKSLGIAAFMPWISKSLLTAFAVVGVLLTVQSLGYDVKALLAGLGIGGLAFALAAQDTLANIFGALVVAVDQPFKVGETVRIGTNIGTVEDIGLRSTRIRLIDKSLMVIPNKTVASETITNLSRFTRRRVEQVIGLTYDTTPEQLESLVPEVRRFISSHSEVDAAGVLVFFRDFGASSLDLWCVYEITFPDFAPAMEVRQRINVGLMRILQTRGLAFAFPSQTVYLAGDAPARPPAA